jgi:two-component system, NarL family, nitrate/nitrite response regulator NarL
MLRVMALTCVIVDDSPSVQIAARSLLEREGIEVVGVCGTSAETIAVVAALRPDVTLVDIDLGSESGFDLVERLSPARTVLMSLHAEADFTELIEASSALGFLPKARLSAAAIEAFVSAPPGMR